MAGKIITVTQQKGGSGKTTISAHLAAALASKRGKTVAIIDTDPQGSLGRWFMARFEDFEDEEPSMTLRTASAWGARYEARTLARTHDYVIIDTPPKLGGDAKPAIQAADLVLVPVAASPVDLWATEPTIEMIESEKKESRIVLNRVNSRAKITGEITQALAELGAKATKTTLGNRVVFAASMGDGLTAPETNKNANANREINDLAAEVIKILKKQ